MMKRILVPTDFSNNAYNALLYATRLFKEEVHIIILHSFEDAFSGRTSRIDIGKNEELLVQLRKETQTRLAEIKHTIIRDSEEYSCTFEVTDSTLGLYKAINKIIARSTIDMVIMGTKGASGLKEILMGSQAVKVVQKIKTCPLLLIPSESDFSPPKHLCFATDFEDTFKSSQLNVFKTIAGYSKGTIHIAHIYNQKESDSKVEANYKRLKKYLGTLPNITHWIVNKSTKARTLQEFITLNDIDFLAMIYHKHHFFARFLREPVIKTIGFHAKIPFLILPA